jgi:hypothetical protein
MIRVVLPTRITANFPLLIQVFSLKIMIELFCLLGYLIINPKGSDSKKESTITVIEDETIKLSFLIFLGSKKAVTKIVIIKAAVTIISITVIGCTNIPPPLYCCCIKSQQ